MVHFTSLSRHVRLAFTCVAVLGLMAMTAPAVHANTITENWDGDLITGNSPSWPSQWEFINPNAGLTFSIKNNTGYVEPTVRPATPYTFYAGKALIKSSAGTFTDSRQDVDFDMNTYSGQTISMLARYNASRDINGIIPGTESFYEAYLDTHGAKFEVSILRTNYDGVTSTTTSLMAPSEVVYPAYANKNLWSQMAFTVQDVLGGVQLDFSYTSGKPNSSTSLFSVLDSSTDQLTGSGQVGFAGSISTRSGRHVAFDNYKVTGPSVSSPVPEPASLTLLGLGGLLMFAGNRRRR